MQLSSISAIALLNLNFPWCHFTSDGETIARCVCFQIIIFTLTIDNSLFIYATMLHRGKTGQKYGKTLHHYSNRPAMYMNAYPIQQLKEGN